MSIVREQNDVKKNQSLLFKAIGTVSDYLGQGYVEKVLAERAAEAYSKAQRTLRRQDSSSANRGVTPTQQEEAP